MPQARADLPQFVPDLRRCKARRLQAVACRSRGAIAAGYNAAAAGGAEAPFPAR
jgi:hypothetical protein